jgi:hypothetical protein
MRRLDAATFMIPGYSRLVAVLFCFARVTVAQTDSLTQVTTECENGTFGGLTINESFAGRAVGVSLVRISDCSSTVTGTVLPPGRLRSRVAAGLSVGSIIERTPSKNTPVVSYLDAGSSITLSRPDGRETQIPREISGPITSYSFFETIPGGVPDIRNLTTGPAAGRYTVSVPGGRDIDAFRESFDVAPLVLTKPVTLQPIPSTDPPALEWNSADAANGPATVSVTIAKQGLESYGIQCRLEDGRRGAFTIPRDVWERVPATVRAGSTATITTALGATVSLPVGGLDNGLVVSYGPVTIVSAPLMP